MIARRLIRPHADAYRRALAEARSELAAMDARHRHRHDDLLRQLDEVRSELDETRAAFQELRTIVRARQRAESELAELYRELEIARARAAEREPCQPLN